MMSGENKKVGGNSDAGGGPLRDSVSTESSLDTLLLRSLTPADALERSQEAQDLAQVRARLVELANQPHATKPQPKRKRVGTKRVQPVGRTSWYWAAGAAALLAGAVTGWLLIPSGTGKSNVVQTPEKKNPPAVPEITPAPKTENVVKNETPPPIPPVAPEVKHEVAAPKPKPEPEPHGLATTQTPNDHSALADVSHGIAANANAANAKLFLGFNWNCSVTGCQMEHSVYAKDGIAYVERKYAKNASVFGMQDGTILRYIYNTAAQTIISLDPGSRTYFTIKNQDLAADPVCALLRMLDQSQNPKELLSYKKKSGAITTTVTKAEKNFDFSDELLRVPSGYTEVAPPKQ